MKDIVFEIEDQFPGAFEVEVNGIKMWPYIRIMLRYLMVDKKLGNKPQPSPASGWQFSFVRKGKTLWKLLRLAPPFWNRKSTVVIFTNEMEKKENHGEYIDKLSELIAEQLGAKSITINYINPSSEINRKLRNKNAMSGALIELITSKISRYFKPQISESHYALLREITEKYGLSIEDLNARIRYLLAKIKVLKFIFKWRKPSYVITSCYSYFAEVYAAKSAGALTIELQHGIISPLHPGYESKRELNHEFTAENVFVFGNNSIKGLSGNIVNLKKAFPLGNAYLEQLHSQSLRNDILEITRKYKQSVCLPTDYLTELAIISFILPIAKELPDTVFLVVPRASIATQAKEQIKGQDNIIVLENIPFQDVVRHCDFHTATNSTCCLEALSLGIPNILIDTEGRVAQMYETLVSPAFTRFASSREEYKGALEMLHGVRGEDVRNANRDNFEIGYEDNLQNAFKKLGLDTINV